MNTGDTTFRTGTLNRATLKHYGEQYIFEAGVRGHRSPKRHDGDGIITIFESWYDWDVEVEYLEITDNQGNELEMTAKEIKAVIEQVEAEIKEFCIEYSEAIFN